MEKEREERAPTTQPCETRKHGSRRDGRARIALRMGGLGLDQFNRFRALSEVRPIHIRPQLLTGDRTACLSVDDDADLSGYPALRITPKPNCLGSYAHDLRELGVTTLQINRALDVIHARNSTLVEQQIYNRVRG